jgi:osmoprotectant transport system substrate-binding protein
MGGFVRTRVVGGLAAIVLVALGACSSRGVTPAPPPPPGTVVVGSFDFPESEVLAEIYGQALQAKGIPVRLELGLGPRELVQPALLRGLVHLVPEYQGSALGFLGRGRQASSDPATTHGALVHALGGTGVVALPSATAQDANAFAVTDATAARYGIRTLSDLRPIASKLVAGGPPECPERPLCLRGLEDVYGLRFARFIPLDAGGTLTISALSGGDVDVALVFTTDPTVEQRGLRLLEDDLGLEPAENVTPMVARTMLERYGERLTGPVDAVSERLTTDVLVGLNRAVLRGGSAQGVAAAWLSGQGLA